MGFFDRFGFGSSVKNEAPTAEKKSETPKIQVAEQTGAEKERNEAEVLCEEFVSGLRSISNADKQYTLSHPDFAIEKIREARKQIEAWGANPALADLSTRVRSEMDTLSGDKDFKGIFDKVEVREARNLMEKIDRDTPRGFRIREGEKEKVALSADKLLELAKTWEGNPKLAEFASSARSRACDFYEHVGNNRKVAEIKLAEAEKLKEQYLRGVREDYLPTQGLITNAKEGYISAANNFQNAGLTEEENKARAVAEEMGNGRSYGLDPRMLEIDEEKFPPAFFSPEEFGVTVRMWLRRIQEKQANGTEDSQEITEKATLFSESLKECFSLCEKLKLEAGAEGYLNEDKMHALAEAINRVSESFYSLFYADKEAEKWGFDLKYGFYDSFKGYLIETKLIRCIYPTIVLDKDPFDPHYMVTDSRNDSRMTVSSAHSWAIRDPGDKLVFYYAKVETK